MENKTIAFLNSKSWYRALKVLYFIFVALCYIVAATSAIAYWFSRDLELLNIAQLWVIILKILIILLAIFWAWLISKIPQWIFYYIYFGSIKSHE